VPRQGKFIRTEYLATERKTGPRHSLPLPPRRNLLQLKVGAETGRTDSVRGSLAGLSGAPALDEQGRVIGVTIAEAPWRGRIYTTTPETVRRLIEESRTTLPAVATSGETITPGTYGKVADSLRRDLRVAEVVCLT